MRFEVSASELGSRISAEYNSTLENIVANWFYTPSSEFIPINMRQPIEESK